MNQILRKPDWLRTKIPAGENFRTIQQFRQQSGLATVCEEAKCPNQWECWKLGTATFMLLGDTCTRACRFCAVKTMKNPPLPDPDEPQKLAETVRELKLKYAVLTTVDRDDLADFGAGHITACINQIKETCPKIIIELLAPDFLANPDCIATICESKADVLGHNVECVKGLTAKVRDPRASYEQSLEVLRLFKKFKPEMITKSSIMVGFGETAQEVIETMQDLRAADVDILTIGQYLQPDKHKLAVAEYVTPETFLEYEQSARKLGFDYVASGPLVRSSYKAVEQYLLYKQSHSHTPP